MTRALLLTLCLATPALADTRACGLALQRELGHAENWTTVTNMTEALADKDPVLVKYVLVLGAIESGLNASVRRGEAGEIGAFQIMPANVAWLSKRCDVKGPAKNEGVSALLAYCLMDYLLDEAGGDLEAAVAAYNAGQRVIPRVKKYQLLPPVTAQYLWRFNRLVREVSQCRE